MDWPGSLVGKIPFKLGRCFLPHTLQLLIKLKSVTHQLNVKMLSKSYVILNLNVNLKCQILFLKTPMSQSKFFAQDFNTDDEKFQY